MMTRTMGHSAIRKPSRLAVATWSTGIPQRRNASAQAQANEPAAAFHAGSLNKRSIATSHRIGTSASAKEMKSIIATPT